MDLSKINQYTTDFVRSESGPPSVPSPHSEGTEEDVTTLCLNSSHGKDTQSSPTDPELSDTTIVSSFPATRDGTSGGSPFSSSSAASGLPSTSTYVPVDRLSSGGADPGSSASVEDRDALVSRSKTACGVAKGKRRKKGSRGTGDNWRRLNTQRLALGKMDVVQRPMGLRSNLGQENRVPLYSVMDPRARIRNHLLPNTTNLGHG